MRTAVFNGTLHVVAGWYWALRASELRRRPVAVTVMGRELVAYRTGSGEPVLMDAYCPHMGAHLSLGKVDGECLRCFFHNWAFDARGECVDVPSSDGRPPRGANVRVWPSCERNGLVWVWTGAGEPDHPVPEPPELAGPAGDAGGYEGGYESSLGRAFSRRCHPNVMMINAIDEQHFRTVHRVPGHLMRMEPVPVSDRHIRFPNSRPVPTSTAFFRWASRFYRGPLFYQLDYWYGSNGVVSMGPDRLHLYIMFALRQTPDGGTEGQTVVFTRRRKGPVGWAFNRVVLWLTRLAGNYFSVGDTKVFETIKFDYKTPVPADRAVQAFIRHLESQPLADWPDDSGPAGRGKQAAAIPRSRPARGPERDPDPAPTLHANA